MKTVSPIVSRFSFNPDTIEFLPEYLNKRTVELRSVTELIHVGDFLGLQYIGHRIKGNAGMFGFDELGELGGLLEDAAIRKDGNEIIRLADEMLKYLDEAKSLLASRVP